MHAWMHAWVHAWMHACMDAFMPTSTHASNNLCVHVCMYACTHVCMYAHMFQTHCGHRLAQIQPWFENASYMLKACAGYTLNKRQSCFEHVSSKFWTPVGNVWETFRIWGTRPGTTFAKHNIFETMFTYRKTLANPDGWYHRAAAPASTDWGCAGRSPAGNQKQNPRKLIGLYLNSPYDLYSPPSKIPSTYF